MTSRDAGVLVGSGTTAGAVSLPAADPRTGGVVPGEVLVRFAGVQRHYVMGDTTVKALDGIDLDIKRGEYWAIMGRSGSGKSTLLNILGCLDRPTGGEYYLGGTPVSQLDDDALAEIRGQRIGFVFQSFNLIPQLTVLENLEVPLFYQNAPPREARRRAQQLADRVGLGDRLGHRPLELSGGQQQRVAIARALMNNPLIVLADEATGNLDSKTEQEILDLFDQLAAEGATIILVTHADKVAQRARKILVLRDGHIHRIVDRESGDKLEL